MEIAMVSELRGDQFVIRTINGDGASMNLTADVATPLVNSFCLRVLAGTLPAVIPEVRRHPVTRDLSATREFGIGAYVGVPLNGSNGKPAGMNAY